ncbi:MAG: hypothetical protein QHI38_05990 [Armatimonadota bacterium]|nr:hypothetical protein [Armatimonadota bacterium]
MWVFNSLIIHRIALSAAIIITTMGVVEVTAASDKLDIRPFALPNTPANEVRFEDPREIERVVVTFAQAVPENVGLSYLRKLWPEVRIETRDPYFRVQSMGWWPIDDWFNSKWHTAAVDTRRVDDKTVEITFKNLKAEFPDLDYDVTFRRTLGIKVDCPDPTAVQKIEIYTRSLPVYSSIRVTLDAGQPTSAEKLQLSAYNAEILSVKAESGVDVEGCTVRPRSGEHKSFIVELKHLKPTHLYSYDDGHVSFSSENDMFTISLESLAQEGPIWFEDWGVYITRADDATRFDYYKREAQKKLRYNQMIVQKDREQALGGAMNGQPRPHAVAYSVGCKNAWQRFWIEPNGDIVLTRNHDPAVLKGKDAGRYKTDGHGRFFFGLEKWISTGRFPDPAPVLVYNIHKMRDDLALEQKILAVPLFKKVSEQLVGDDPIVGLVRFRFTNLGADSVVAELPLSYSNNSRRSRNRLSGRGGQTDDLVPMDPRDKLSFTVSENGEVKVFSEWHGEQVLRCVVRGEMAPVRSSEGMVFCRELKPGHSCELILKIPYMALENPEELDALAKLDFETAYKEVAAYWRTECNKGAQLHTPEPNLDALYKSHLAHVHVTDFRMPAEPELINTSVGTSTYGNFSNESCMIIQELEERGLHEEARARLATWLRYQGTKALLGNFTDHDGVFYGCGGFEGGDSYDQHHGWVLWALAEHYFMTGDADWYRSIADKVLKGIDWVARQRRQTMGELPHSRGWERGWLAAGGLEDVDDFFYWLSTNALTWRGVEATARALEAINHPEAARVRAEADDYRNCLIRGFEISRQHAPLVRLRDGRWVPTYPSRLYRRGRDVGWIREVLEGSVYLLISGLYDVHSKQAQWILDDYQDNRYISPLYGYPFPDVEATWWDYGGFSNQPTLLAGLLPHIERDEPEIYIWMFFNAWAACYREEINAMVEHPSPYLGWSNTAHFKTSDQSNAVKWLRYMFVYVTQDGVLHFGRALPRAWFTDGQDIYAYDVATRFGKVGVRYKSAASEGRITAEVDLALRNSPKQVLVRIRHPEKAAIKSVTVNGRSWDKFDPVKGDVDVTGLTGKLTVEAQY